MTIADGTLLVAFAVWLSMIVACVISREWGWFVVLVFAALIAFIAMSTMPCSETVLGCFFSPLELPEYKESTWVTASIY